MANQREIEVGNPVIPWWLVLIEGIAAIIVGILLFAKPAATMIVLIQFLGVYWLITGIFSLVSLFWDRSDWGWKLFNGILGVLAGILIIQNPLWSTLLVPTTLAIVIGVTGIIIGMIQLIQAFRGGGWGIGVLGALSILLGFLLIARPVVAGLALPWVLGGFLIAGGLLALFAAFGLRGAEKQAKEAKAQSTTRSPAIDVRQEMVGTAATGETVASGAVAGAAGLTAVGVEAIEAKDEIEPEQPESKVEFVSGFVKEEDQAASGFAVDLSDSSLTGNVDTTDPEEMAKFKYALEYVEGIGPVYAGQLKTIGLETCLDLLRSGASRKGRETIAEQSGISGKLILEWVNHVDLYRVKGIGSEYADLLEAAGVDTVVELAQRNPNNLFEKVNEVNATKSLVRKLPTLSQVEDWVNQAKNLPRVVTY
jgi:uncharacterized membrane protein HdeD (DUF308 family)/predicted flap endonuclease-1-like 5' DNA nuclease